MYFLACLLYENNFEILLIDRNIHTHFKIKKTKLTFFNYTILLLCALAL